MATIAANDYSMPIGGEWVRERRRAVRRHEPGHGRGRRHRRQRDGRATSRARSTRPRPHSGRGRRWPRSSAARILRRASDRILAEADHIAGVMTDEQGKPLAEARGEVVYAACFLEWFAGEAERVYGMTCRP